MSLNPEAVLLAEELHDLRNRPVPSFVDGQRSVFSFIDLPCNNTGGGNVLVYELDTDDQVVAARKVSITDWVGEFRELTKPRVPRNLLGSVAGALAFRAWHQNRWETDPEFEGAF